MPIPPSIFRVAEREGKMGQFGRSRTIQLLNILFAFFVAGPVWAQRIAGETVESQPPGEVLEDCRAPRSVNSRCRTLFNDFEYRSFDMILHRIYRHNPSNELWNSTQKLKGQIAFFYDQNKDYNIRISSWEPNGQGVWIIFDTYKERKSSDGTKTFLDMRSKSLLWNGRQSSVVETNEYYQEERAGNGAVYFKPLPSPTQPSDGDGSPTQPPPGTIFYKDQKIGNGHLLDSTVDGLNEDSGNGWFLISKKRTSLLRAPEMSVFNQPGMDKLRAATEQFWIKHQQVLRIRTSLNDCLQRGQRDICSELEAVYLAADQERDNFFMSLVTPNLVQAPSKSNQRPVQRRRQ